MARILRGSRLAVVALTALAAIGCSGGPTDRVVMDDFAFAPDVIRLPAETEGYTLLLDNVGSQPHDLTVDGLPEGTPVHLLLFEDTTDVPYVLPPLPAGTYDVRCSLEGHAEAGMVATLVVGGG